MNRVFLKALAVALTLVLTLPDFLWAAAGQGRTLSWRFAFQWWGGGLNHAWIAK